MHIFQTCMDFGTVKNAYCWGRGNCYYYYTVTHKQRSLIILFNLYETEKLFQHF